MIERPAGTAPWRNAAELNLATASSGDEAR